MTKWESKQMTLKDAYENFSGDRQQDIPFLVWLLENPDSPFPFPGQIRLYDHDCLHIILNKGKSPSDEAYVVGFTMGNDPMTRLWHLKMYKFFAQYVYPNPYRFQKRDLSQFEMGFRHGYSSSIKSLNSTGLSRYLNHPIESIRSELGITQLLPA